MHIEYQTYYLEMNSTMSTTTMTTILNAIVRLLALLARDNNNNNHKNQINFSVQITFSLCRFCCCCCCFVFVSSHLNSSCDCKQLPLKYLVELNIFSFVSFFFLSSPIPTTEIRNKSAEAVNYIHIHTQTHTHEPRAEFPVCKSIEQEIHWIWDWPDRTGRPPNHTHTSIQTYKHTTGFTHENVENAREPKQHHGIILWREWHVRCHNDTVPHAAQSQATGKFGSKFSRQ